MEKKLEENKSVNSNWIIRVMKNIVRGFSYLLGTFIPNITFIIIFITFMLTIVSRYVFRTPITWSYEISVLGYMWTMFFGVGKAIAMDEHVVFSLVYDKFNDTGKAALKVVYNLILIGLLVAIMHPCIDSLLSKKMVTGVLKLPYTIVFAPLIYMFAETIIRSIIEIFKTLKNTKALNETKKSEV